MKVSLAILILSQAALAQEIISLDPGGNLHSIDPTTGIATRLGDTGIHGDSWTGFAQDSHGRLYSAIGSWIVGFSIYELDPTTGAATFVTDTPYFGLFAMEFDSNDNLFVVNDPDFPASSGRCELYNFDLNTGLSTHIGGTGVGRIQDLAFYDSELFGHCYSYGLIRIDTTTGAATNVNPKFRGYPSQVSGLCFDQNGTLYGAGHSIWMFDRESGNHNPVNWITNNSGVFEAVFREGHTPNFALWLDGTAGHYMGAKMTGATPNSQVMLMWAKGEGGPTPIPPGLPCPGRLMDLNSNMGKVAIANTDATGSATIGPGPRRVPIEAAGLVWLQAIDVSTCEKSNRIQLFY
jgi:hypothetical protein